MTKQYIMYLQIARLIAKRARLVRLIQLHPNNDKLLIEYALVNKQIKYHKEHDD